MARKMTFLFRKHYDTAAKQTGVGQCMVRGEPVSYIFHPSIFPRFTVFNNILKIGVHFCEREDIHGDGDQYEFPDDAGISPEEGVAVLDRCTSDKLVPSRN